MRSAFIAFIVLMFILVGACAPTKLAKTPGSQKGEILTSPENVKIYDADYDTTFRAALSALRLIKASRSKFVRHSEGVIIFKGPDDAETTTVNVTKEGEGTTRVAIAFENNRKKKSDTSSDATRDAFFEEVEKLLGGTVADKSDAEAEQLQKAAGEKIPPQEVPDIRSIRQKVEQALQLDEEANFLDALSYEALVVLDQKVEALVAVSWEKEKVSRRCAACYIDLARFYHDDKVYDRSAEALKIAIAMEPDNALAHCNLGEIYKHLGLYQEAILELQKAERLDPELPDTYINLGIIYDDYLVDDKKALENYKKYLDLGGDGEQVVKWIADIEGGS